MKSRSPQQLAEETYNLSVAALYAAAEAAGYEQDEIVSFAFRESFLTEEQITTNNKMIVEGFKPPYSAAVYHNAVRLKSDSGDILGLVAQIPLTLRPQPPEDASVSMERKS